MILFFFQFFPIKTQSVIDTIFEALFLKLSRGWPPDPRTPFHTPQ